MICENSIQLLEIIIVSKSHDLFWFFYVVELCYKNILMTWIDSCLSTFTCKKLWEFKPSSRSLGNIFEYHGWHFWTSNTIFRKSSKIPWKSSNFRILKQISKKFDFLHFQGNSLATIVQFRLYNLPLEPLNTSKISITLSFIIKNHFLKVWEKEIFPWFFAIFRFFTKYAWFQKH